MAAVMHWERVPELPLFTGNTAAFVHEMESRSISDVNGLGDHVRVQVLTQLGGPGRPSWVPGGFRRESAGFGTISALP
jgi:hypothetical protein